MKNAKLTNLIPIKLSHFSVIGLLFVLNIPSAIPADAPGNIAQEPLQTSATAEPNIMFLIDDSGSMDGAISASNSDNRWATLVTTMNDLLDGLNGVYVGFSSFKEDGKIAQHMTLLDKSDLGYTTTLSDMKTTVYDLGGAAASGYPTLGGFSTQVGNTMHLIGRYFARGNVSTACGAATTNGDLVIHPGEADEATHSCTSLLGGTKTNVTDLGEAIQWSCQKSFTIVMSDGESRGDNLMRSSNTAWTGDATKRKLHPLADYDDDCHTNASDATDYTCTSDDDNKPSPYSYGTDGSDYLDDIAQALYEIDLRPDYTDFKNNITTYAIGFGDTALQTMEDTGTQAGGEYYFADDAAKLLSSFQSAINSILEQTSTSSAVTFNSSTLSSQSAVYQALYNTASWSGELNSYPIDGLTGAIETTCTQGTNNCWRAADKLDAQTPSNRFIIVAGDNTTKHGVEFKYTDTSTSGTDDYTNLNSSSDIPQALVADLCSIAVGDASGTSFPCLTSDTAGATRDANGEYIEDLVNYLRGDNSEELAATSIKRNFRNRVSDLADIVNSSPIYVGAAQQGWPSSGDFPTLDSSIPSTDYNTWATAVKYRPEIVYVASNDGMLHGFRAENANVGDGEDINTSAGEEVFSFIPTGTFSTQNSEGLHFLADKDYTHRFYNDLTPSISDVYIDYRNADGSPTGPFVLTEATKNNPTAQWRTVILGSQGGGGKSLYLLDVTDPTEYTDNAKQNPEKLVLWEFSDSDDSSLGFTYSKPTIAMMNNGKFAAIFGNGYNSSSCKAEIFVVFLEGGLDGTWTINQDYFKYDTGTASGGGAGDCNGMSTPAVVDLDGNGTADRVYAGDLKGNLWAFDLCAEVTDDAGDCNTSAAAWGLAHADPLMNANNSAEHDGSQPITSKPVVSLDPDDGANGVDDLIIVFGTGQYLVDGDKLTTGLQRMYGVRDYDALNNSSAGINGEWDLDGNVGNKWAETVLTLDGGTGTRVISSEDDVSNNYGWRIDLPDSGERVVVNPKIRNDIVFFNTLIPEDAKCTYGGSGWIMSVNLLNGGAPTEPVFDLNGDGFIDEYDVTADGSIPAGQNLNEIPAESTFLGDNQYTPGSDSTINVRKVSVGKNQREGRMSWKELFEDN